MAKDSLSILFGNKARLKIMRLFIGNQNSVFSNNEIALKIKESLSLVKKEIDLLKSVGFVSAQKIVKEIEKKVRGKKVSVKEKVQGFAINRKFEYLPELSDFLLKTAVLDDKDITRRLSVAGKVKLVIVTGHFIQNTESRVDILLVADSLKINALDKAIKALEAELGRELRYSAFEMADFQYRLDMYDKLVRDVIDYPHRVIFDKIGIAGK